MIKAILIDDEKLALKVMREMLKSFHEIEVAGAYTDPVQAIADMKEIKPDVIFLDIEMGEHHGIDVADKILEVNTNVEIIFVTAYSEYAIEAFELNAIDYLLKPVNPERLAKSLKRIKEEKEVKEETKRIEPKHKLYIQSFGNFIIFDENKQPIHWRTSKAKELFAFLWAHQGETQERSYLIETLFPDRDADRAATLFSTTLYQLRKNLKKYLGDDFITQVNRNYVFEARIESDYKKICHVISSNTYQEEDLSIIKQYYKHGFLEYEDYAWKSDLALRISNNLKIYLVNMIETLNQSEMGNPAYEDALLYLYYVDRIDDTSVQKLIQFYRTTNQITKLIAFYEEHIRYLEEEIDIEIPSYLKNLLKNK